MKEYIRLLPLIKGLWPLVFLGFLFSLLYGLAGGFSLPMIYPVLGKIFNTQPTAAELSAEPIWADFLEFVSTSAGVAMDMLARRVDMDTFKATLGDGIKGISLHHPAVTVVSFFCIIGAFMFFIKHLAGVMQRFCYLVVQENLMIRLYRKMFGHCMELPLGFYHKQRSGELISRFVFDAQQIKTFSIQTMGNTVHYFFQVIIYFTMAMFISARMLLISAIVIPPVILVVGRLARALKRRARRIQVEMAHITNFLNESFGGIKVIIGFGRKKEQNQRFFDLSKKYLRAAISLGKFDALAKEITPFMTNVLGIAIGYIVIRSVISGAVPMNGELFVVFLLVVASMMSPILNIGKAYSEMKKGAAAVDRVFNLMETPVTVEQSPDAVPISDFESKIEFKNVWFAYKDERWVLEDVNFSVERGEIVALVGPSGGGKTTMADLLARFYDPNEGHILIDGRDIRDYNIINLRHLMGIVTQDTILFNFTIRENLTFAKPDATDEELYEALRIANALEFVMEFPERLETSIGERGVRLSGGQKQRLCIARALLANPNILIFDEATSSLDNESEFLVQQAIERMMRNRTSLVIAHRLSTVRNADRIMVVDRGKVVGVGTHEELMSSSPLYKKLYEMQFQVDQGNDLGNLQAKEI
jgi:subfamily B ATP-binding cassette protein MsbA